MSPAWPEDAYLLQVGKVVYSIASIEGLLIFDLQRMPTAVGGLSPGALAGKTTTGIGRRFLELAPSVPEQPWREYLARGGEALVDLGPKRNSVLHARPATIEGAQRLLRWRLDPMEIIPISFTILAEMLDEVDAHLRELNRLRPPTC
jgi:hypothetical protein